jgi:hypothetical protein
MKLYLFNQFITTLHKSLIFQPIFILFKKNSTSISSGLECELKWVQNKLEGLIFAINKRVKKIEFFERHEVSLNNFQFILEILIDNHYH